jgi:hypothetical protein
MTIRTDPPSLRWSQPACRGARSRLLQTGAGAAEAAAAECSVIGDAAAGVAGEQHTEGDHAQCQDEVQPVVGAVDGDEVGCAAVVDEQPVQPQHRIDSPAENEVVLRAAAGAGQHQARDTEGGMDEVVQDRHREHAQQERPRFVPGEAQLVVVGRHARHEAEDADEQEHPTDDCGGELNGVSSAHAGPTGCAVVGHLS